MPWTVATPRMPWTEAPSPSPCVVDAPDELCCPITLELMLDPVQTILGQTYEREAIEDWLKTHKDGSCDGREAARLDCLCKRQGLGEVPPLSHVSSSVAG